MLFIYNVLLIIYFIVTLPFYAVQMLRREKYRAGLAQRLGFYPSPLRTALRGKRSLWIHAVSVGEVTAVAPLVAQLNDEFPDRRIVVSTVTMTGQKVARDTLGRIATVIYFPLDFRGAVGRAMRLVKPSLIILVETEIWPNFICGAARAAVPLLIVNGRISDRSYRGYLSGRFFLGRFLRAIDLFSMQTELDAERIRALGAPAGRVKVTGNMKFDCGLEPADEGARREAAARLGIGPERRVIVAGSTHRGEEDILLDIFRDVKETHPDAVLIIVPRHPERGGEVAALAGARGLDFFLRSSQPGGGPMPPRDVLIVDTIGELVGIYRAASLVFVGKSLTGGGGQNIIEPASMGKPVLFGPSMENFREAARILLSHRAALMVADGAELREAILSLLEDEGARRELGRRAAEIMARSRGATRRNLNLIKEITA